MLTAKQVSNMGCQTSEHNVGCVNDVPVASYVAWLWGVRTHLSALLLLYFLKLELSNRTCFVKQARLQRLPVFTGFGQNEPVKSRFLPVYVKPLVASAGLGADLQKMDQSEPATA